MAETLTQPLRRSPRAELPAVSPPMVRWFTWYARRFVRKHFHAVRIARDGSPPAVSGDRALIVFMNHPSWWDPMAVAVLGPCHWPDRVHYGPIDAAMLAKYPFFRKLGMFGLDRTTRRGAADLLRIGGAIATTPGTVLWITAEGRFRDARTRPVRLEPGLAHLWRRCPRAAVVPLALEYCFWTERTPELLVRFGSVLTPPGATIAAIQEQLESALTRELDALASAAIARDPAAFATLLGGNTGTSPVYDAWRWARAKLTGGSFSPAHGDDAPADPRRRP